MWGVYAVLTFVLWGFADLFYKKANQKEEDKHAYLKTVIIVGIVMGVQALYMLVKSGFQYDFFNLVKYLPVSACYIISMAIGYAGLKYIELSVASPVQNSSGAIATILCIIFFSYALSVNEAIGIVFIIIGIILLAYLESKANDKENSKIVSKKYRISFLAIMFPIVYCLFDGLGTFLDAVYLDEFSLISEENALIAYELIFFIVAIVSYVFLKFIKKEKVQLLKENNNIIAAVLETAGQFFYVYAMATNATISAVVVSSYCVLSLVLSRIFLKEKLSLKQYLLIAMVFVGIILTVI